MERATRLLAAKGYPNAVWRIENRRGEPCSAITMTLRSEDPGLVDEIVNQYRRCFEGIFMHEPRALADNSPFGALLQQAVEDAQDPAATGDEPVIIQTRQRRRWWQLWLPR